MCSSKCFAKPQKMTLLQILQERAAFGESKNLGIVDFDIGSNSIKILAEDAAFLNSLKRNEKST